MAGDSAPIDPGPVPERDGAGPDLAVHLPNWVGDTCNAIPTLHGLRAAGFRLHLFGRGWAPALLAGLGVSVSVLDRVVFRAARSVRSSGCTHGLLMPRTVRSAASFWLARVPTVGFPGKLRRSWMVTHHATYHHGGGHTAHHYWSLGAAACELWAPSAQWPADPPPRIKLPLIDADRQAARRALNGIPRQFVVVGSRAVGQVKRVGKVWPHWPELSRRLIARGLTLVACPGPGEEQPTREAVPGAHVLAGLGIGAIVAVMSEARLVVANDSGSSHLGAASGARTLGIFGVSSPRLNCPWGNDSIGGADGWPSCDEVLDAVVARLD